MLWQSPAWTVSCIPHKIHFDILSCLKGYMLLAGVRGLDALAESCLNGKLYSIEF